MIKRTVQDHFIRASYAKSTMFSTFAAIRVKKKMRVGKEFGWLN